MKKQFNINVLILLLFIVSVSSLNAQDSVFVNDVLIPEQTIKSYESYYKIQIQDGSYWYDKYTGAWGVMGGPGLGFIPPHLPLGGVLKENASNGNTKVFVNGRELHWKDVAYLQQFIQVIPGRFWVDYNGNGGYEGQPATFNLFVLARQNGKTFHRNSYTDIGSGSNGGTFYVIGEDFSLIMD